MTYRNPIDGQETVLIAAGPAIFGTRDDDPDGKFDGKPQFTAALHAYYLGIYCVTNAQYAAFLNASGPEGATLEEWVLVDADCHVGHSRSGVYAVADPQYADHPMTQVSWFGARAYCDWAGLRLPTELEWEKGARGPEGLVYPWGNEWDAGLCRNSVGRPAEGTCAVSAYPAGAGHWGVLNMAGNVWEWCQDWYDPGAYARHEAGDLSSAQSGETRCLRGEAWCNDLPVDLRSTYRDHAPAVDRYPFAGFRCARDATD